MYEIAQNHYIIQIMCIVQICRVGAKIVRIVLNDIAISCIVVRWPYTMHTYRVVNLCFLEAFGCVEKQMTVRCQAKSIR